MAGTVSLEAMSGAVAFVRREYGDHGYSIGLTYGSYGRAGLFTVEHSDGSAFDIVVDRFGNAYRCCDRDCLTEGSYRRLVGGGSYLCDDHDAMVTA